MSLPASPTPAIPEKSNWTWIPIRSLGPRHRERIAAHLLSLNESDRYLRFGYTASDGALALTYPNGWTQFGSPPEPYFSDEALLTHLRKESTAEAGRFALWAERTIAFPARRLRERTR